MGEERNRAPSHHTVSMENREHISITGVLDVLSFDEETIIADTELGTLLLRGEQLHVGKLNMDDGELLVEGHIDSLEYSEGSMSLKGKRSLWGKIFK